MLAEVNNGSFGYFDENYPHDILFRRCHKYLTLFLPEEKKRD